ncbi:hypothetical protein [Streptomyces cinereospinus]|uniref:Tetracyclin repressor-like C-terminal domain-containing protein n=1 Tax=Streptomyces cinereospinus TaxID=285561 RepID=A0ABV5NBW3_9ACTN
MQQVQDGADADGRSLDGLALLDLALHPPVERAGRRPASRRSPSTAAWNRPTCAPRPAGVVAHGYATLERPEVFDAILLDFLRSL